jgi:hypothetical protein
MGTTNGINSNRPNAALNQSFREEEDEYDQEVDHDGASNTNIFRKTNIEEYGSSLGATFKGSAASGNPW